MIAFIKAYFPFIQKHRIVNKCVWNNRRKITTFHSNAICFFSGVLKYFLIIITIKCSDSRKNLWFWPYHKCLMSFISKTFRVWTPRTQATETQEQNFSSNLEHILTSELNQFMPKWGKKFENALTLTFVNS